MSVVIPDEVLDAAGMSGAELVRELAVLLFQRERLGVGQASRLAGTGWVEFQHLLASRQIPVHYGATEFEADLETLEGIRRP